jgi:hypothetical protein
VVQVRGGVRPSVDGDVVPTALVSRYSVRLRVVVPAMPAAFVLVWLGVFLAAFAWLRFGGPVCWPMVGSRS